MKNSSQNYAYSLILIPTEKNVFFDDEDLFIKVATELKKTAARCHWHIDDIMHDDDHVYITVEIPVELPLDEIVKLFYEDKHSPFTTQLFWSGDYTVRAVYKS